MLLDPPNRPALPSYKLQFGLPGRLFGIGGARTSWVGWRKKEKKRAIGPEAEAVEGPSEIGLVMQSNAELTRESDTDYL